jgi:hypothetical protein
MIPVNEFTAALALVVSHAGSQSDPRLNNVVFDFQADDTLRLIGTNGHRLAAIELRCAHGQPAGTRFVLYVEYAQQLIRILGAASGQLSIWLLGTEIMFIAGGSNALYPAPETAAELPDYDSILQRDGGTAGRLYISVAYLAKALTVCSKLMDPKDPAIHLAVAGADAPLYLEPVLRDGLTAVRRVRIAIMYRRP